MERRRKFYPPRRQNVRQAVTVALKPKAVKRDRAFGPPMPLEIRNPAEARRRRSTMPMRHTIDAVATFYGVAREEIAGQTRRAAIAHKRQTVCYIAARCYGLSLPSIGRALSGRDHTTILHAVRVVEKRLMFDEQLRADITDLCGILEMPVPTFPAMTFGPPVEFMGRNHPDALRLKPQPVAQAETSPAPPEPAPPKSRGLLSRLLLWWWRV